MISTSRIIVFILALGSGLIFSGVDFRAGLTLRLFDIGIILGILLFYGFVLPRGIPAKGLTAFLFVAGAYILYVTTNGIFLTNKSTGIKEGIQLFLFLNFFLMMVYCLRHDAMGTTPVFLFFFLAALWLVALYNAGFHISQGAISGWKSLDEPKLSHSVLLTVVVVMTMTYAQRSNGWRAMLVMAILFLILSGERKGWLGAVVGIFMATLISDSGRLEKRTIGRALSVIGTVAILILAVLPIADRIPYVGRQVGSMVDFVRLVTSGDGYLALLTADTTFSNRARIFGIQQAIEMYSSSPTFGVGVENYKRVVNSLNVVDEFKKGAHNEVLRIAAELGTVGLTLYMMMYVVCVGRIRRALASMPRFTEDQKVRLRLGTALLAYGFAANLFLGGGGLNLFLIFLPAALIYSVPLLNHQPSGPPVRFSWNGQPLSKAPATPPSAVLPSP